MSATVLHLNRGTIPCEGTSVGVNVGHRHTCALPHGHVEHAGIPHACSCGHEWVHGADIPAPWVQEAVLVS